MKKKILIEIGVEELPLKNFKNISIFFKKYFINEFNKIKFKTINIRWFITSRRIALKFILDILNIKEIKLLIIFLIKIVIKKLKKFNFVSWDLYIDKFIRPINTILFLLNNELIKFNFYNIISNNISYGHRFIKKNNILIKNCLNYKKKLFCKGKVLINYNFRKKKILIDIYKILNKINGYIKLNNNLLNELNSLLEWPYVLLSKLSKKYLLLPIKLINFIILKFKYILIFCKLTNKQLPYFIFISNIELNKFNNIIIGNKNVINSKFFDLLYFLKIDYKNKLHYYNNDLFKIIYFNKLGNYKNKIYRLKKLFNLILFKFNINLNKILRIFFLSKISILTNLSLFFEDLKFIFCFYYFIYFKENKYISLLINEYLNPIYYKINIFNKSIPYLLYIIDKIDEIVGLFNFIKIKKNDNDPYLLRRYLLNIIKIIIKKKININIRKLIKISIFLYKKQNIKINNFKNLINFIKLRIKYYYIKLGYNIKFINSIIYKKIKYLIDINKIIKIFNIKYFKNIKLLIIINKRINNLLKQNKKFIFLNCNINFKILINKYEFLLLKLIKKYKYKINYYYKKRKFKIILLKIIKLCNLLVFFLNNIKIIYFKNKKITFNRILILKKSLKLINSIFNVYFL